METKQVGSANEIYSYSFPSFVWNQLRKCIASCLGFKRERVEKNAERSMGCQTNEFQCAFHQRCVQECIGPRQRGRWCSEPNRLMDDSITSAVHNRLVPKCIAFVAQTKYVERNGITFYNKFFVFEVVTWPQRTIIISREQQHTVKLCARQTKRRNIFIELLKPKRLDELLTLGSSRNRQTHTHRESG